MKILTETEMITKQVIIEHKGIYYIRVEQHNGEASWTSTSYDLLPAHTLEDKYQDLINKPVTTTNEQLTREELNYLHDRYFRGAHSDGYNNEVFYSIKNKLEKLIV